MKTLSVRAPWWWWILYGGKNIENRSRRTHYRGPILIHASKWWHETETAEDAVCAISMFQSSNYCGVIIPGHSFSDQKKLGGHIVGRADIVDCLPPTDLPSNVWHIPGQWGWQLANAKPFRNPMPVKGALGLFETDYVDGPGNMLVKYG